MDGVLAGRDQREAMAILEKHASLRRSVAGCPGQEKANGADSGCGIGSGRFRLPAPIDYGDLAVH